MSSGRNRYQEVGIGWPLVHPNFRRRSSQQRWLKRSYQGGKKKTSTEWCPRSQVKRQNKATASDKATASELTGKEGLKIEPWSHLS